MTLPGAMLALSSVLLAACGGAYRLDADVGPDGGDAGEAEIDWQSEFDHVFPRDRVVAIRIDFHDTGAYQEMITAASIDSNDTPFFRADLTFDDEVVTDVGVRLKGNSSLWGSADDQMKSFKVHFEEYVDGQALHGVDRLNLHNGFMDPSLLRERLAYDLANDFGIDAPRAAHAEVWIDGERHGVYSMVQQVDSRFLKEHFGEEDGADDGNLYKCHDGCPLAYWGDDPAYYRGFPPEGVPAPPCDEETDECGLELETNEDDPELADFADVVTLTRTIRDVLEGGASTEALEAVLDMEHYVRFQAWSLVLSNLDSYFGSAHNFYLYRRPNDDRFQFVPWDTNLAYGTFECPEFSSEIEPVLGVDLFLPCFDEERVPPPLDRPKPLVALVSMRPEYRRLYCDALEEIVDGLYTIEDQDARIAELHDVIGEARQVPSVLGQPPFDFTYEDYRTALGGEPDVSFGRKTVHSLGYFNRTRLADVEAQIESSCR